MLTGLIPMLASPGPSAAARGDWLAILAGIAALLEGIAAWAAPSGAVPAWLDLAVPAWAAAALAAAGALLLVAVHPRHPAGAARRHPRRGGRGDRRAFPFAAAAAAPGTVGPAAFWLAAVGLVVAVWPFLGIRLERGTASTLACRFAWALFAAATLPLCLGLGVVAGQAQRMLAEQDEAARLRTAEGTPRGWPRRSAGSARSSPPWPPRPVPSPSRRSSRIGCWWRAGRNPGLDTLLLLDGERRVVAKAGGALAGEAVLQSAASPRLAFDPRASRRSG